MHLQCDRQRLTSMQYPLLDKKKLDTCTNTERRYSSSVKYCKNEVRWRGTALDVNPIYSSVERGAGYRFQYREQPFTVADMS